MTIRDCIRQAADHIEQFPQRFKFLANHVPQSLDGCGCALGWIGHFSGQFPVSVADQAQGLGVTVEHVADRFLQVKTPERRPIFSAVEFYERMTKLCGSDAWTISASLCATGLRKYADQYHPSDIPDSVREIFTPRSSSDPSFLDFMLGFCVTHDRAMHVINRSNELTRLAKRHEDLAAIADVRALA